MSLIPTGGRVFGALVVLLVVGPARAESGAGPGSGYEPGPRYHRHAPGQPLPPEVRYRDPGYLPPPRRAQRFGPPPQTLIQAYLPRHTETPMYNEPPSRFPQR